MEKINTSALVDNQRSRASRYRALPVESARLRSGFWFERQVLNARVSLRYGCHILSQNGSFDNFRRCAGLPVLVEPNPDVHESHDTHVYKWLEAVAWQLAHDDDPELREYVNEVVPLIEAAQAQDGYLVTPILLFHPEKKWADLHFGHEMYCAGHLIQAGLALKRACADERLLAVACRFADHIDSVFGPGKRSGTCGHPEIEMALVELYRETGEERYLKLAAFLIDERGRRRLSGLGSYGPEYHQDHAPLREAKEAIGHAVRQLYLAAGAADLYMETGEPALLQRLDDLWWDITGARLHITGGAGARFEGEAFGDPYELPTDQCYCETCAAIGSAMWNFRMLLAKGESRFADAIEQAMFNAILCCPALDGQHYFYANPLMLRDTRFLRLSSNRPDENRVEGARSGWHHVACCPTNVMRFLSSLNGYFATQSNAALQVQQYGNFLLSAGLPGEGPVSVEMKTDYPWSGEIHLEIKETPGQPWRLELRLPGWCERYSIEINGLPAELPANEKGYLSIERAWQPGDTLRLSLDMPPRLMLANPRVDALRGCAAILKGPLVYCFESHDQPEGTNLLDIQLNPDAPLREEWAAGLLSGVVLVHVMGTILDPQAWGRDLYRPLARLPQPQQIPLQLTAVPYYAWGNRGLKTMRVWAPLRRI